MWLHLYLGCSHTCMWGVVTGDWIWGSFDADDEAWRGMHQHEPGGLRAGGKGTKNSWSAGPGEDWRVQLESPNRGRNKQSNPYETKNVHVGEEAQRASLPPADSPQLQP